MACAYAFPTSDSEKVVNGSAVFGSETNAETSMSKVDCGK